MKMRKGFTLIELLIVLAIIAALMAVVTPIALNAVRKAKATQVAENIRNIKAAVESYVNIQQDEDLTDLSVASLVNTGYLNSSPGDYYEIWGATQTDVGVYAIDIVYTGTDIDPAEVAKVSQDVVEASNLAVATLTIQKWW